MRAVDSVVDTRMQSAFISGENILVTIVASRNVIVETIQTPRAREQPIPIYRGGGFGHGRSGVVIDLQKKKKQNNAISSPFDLDIRRSNIYHNVRLIPIYQKEQQA